VASAEEGFSGLNTRTPIGPVPQYPPAADGRDGEGGFTFSVQRLDSEGRCVITDHKVRGVPVPLLCLLAALAGAVHLAV
jgi:hypothetical protein